MSTQFMEKKEEKKSELILETLPIQGYEKVIKVTHLKGKLQAIIAIHSTALGKALGGTRIYPYSSFDQALTDVLKLAKGMSYKSAIAGTGLGGGKAVIIANPKTDKTEELLLAFAEAVDSLNGEFITAEDSGSEEKDFAIMNKKTKYLVGFSHEKSGGSPSRFTAWGICRGIQAVLQKLYGSDSVKDRKIVIQGVGSVGELLVELLFWQGADITITDINIDTMKRVAKKYGTKMVAPDEIYYQECDIFSPCGFGGIINRNTIPMLRCKAIAGSANNQLLTDEDGEALKQRKILYAPDFVINGGGLINVSQEVAAEGYHPKKPREKSHNIYQSLLTIFEEADKKNVSTHQAAVSLAEYRIGAGIGRRLEEPCFHCSLENCD
ncbi:MAG: Leu/Phe/Val dehydrogenase [Candidatus Rhabdochlamydia sp.]